jgi:hypothetical protein
MMDHVVGHRLYLDHWCFFPPLQFARQRHGKALNMMDILVGSIGLVLILYLWVSILRPEKF